MYLQRRCWHLILITLLRLYVFILKCLRWIMVYCCSHYNKLGSYTFTYSIFLWGCHERLFTRVIKIIQEVFTALEWVKGARLIDDWIICNRRFLILCFINCIFFLFVLILLWTLYDSLYSVEILSTITLSDSILSAEYTWDKFLSAMIPFYSLLYK